MRMGNCRGHMRIWFIEKIQKSKFKIQNSKFKIQKPKAKSQKPKAKSQKPKAKAIRKTQINLNIF